MEKLFKTKVGIIKNAIIIVSIMALLTVLLITEKSQVLTGLIFGLLISILCFEQLSAAIIKAVELPPEKAQLFVGIRYFIRLFIYAAVLYISIKADYINVIGTLAGLISIKLSILFSTVTKGFK
ncbi:MAG: ATP synthase subunit I [Proteocatella sp.]